MRHSFFALVAAFFLAAPAHAANWADTTETDYAASKAVCQKLKGLKRPALTAAQKSKAACDAQDLYYGIDRKADPAAARLCALNHVANDPDAEQDPFDGRSLLVTIYANGNGAPRDLDVATAYACELDGAPAEMDGRILRLQKLKSDGKTDKAFDICDDATSGLLMGQCAALDADRENAKREIAFKTLEARLTPDQRDAFALLRKAEQTYVATLGDNEVDMSGTARTMQVIGAEQERHDAFVKDLGALIKGDVRDSSAERFAEADRELNKTYEAVMRFKDPQWGTVDKNGIKATQKAWLAYRDAFVAFGQSATPTVSAESLKTVLTKERTALLAAFAE